MPGLHEAVTVHRDEWGIPHIRAVGERDAHWALGFVHAQDRLFQMDLTRRRATGRAAEWLGAEAAEADILSRRLGMEAACRRDLAALGPAARDMLAAYADGVNAFLDSGAALPMEYGLLGAEAERWEPWHSIAVMRRLGLLMGSVWFKLWRTLALPVVGAAEAMKLRYDDGGRDLLCIPPGMTAERWAADLGALRPAIEALLHAMGTDETGGGSNNWAVAPDRTATGRPILAGDPHRVFEVPGMYAQHHLACDAWDAIGLSVPGVPGFPHYMHNGRVAYCVTHAFVDIHDLYLEQFDADGTRVRVGDGWEPVQSRSETVHVRGAESSHRHRHRNAARPGDRRRPCRGRGTRAALGAVRRNRPVVRLPAPYAPCELRAGAVRGDPRLGPDRPQRRGGGHGWPHRPPRARPGAAPPACERLAAGARLDRRGRLARHDPARGDAGGDRPARGRHRHREQPDRGGR